MYTGWSGDEAVEQTVKNRMKATIRVLPGEEFRSPEDTDEVRVGRWGLRYRGGMGESVLNVGHEHDRVLIFDFGSQFTQLIARRIREESVYCEIHPPTRDLEWIQGVGSLGGDPLWRTQLGLRRRRARG